VKETLPGDTPLDRWRAMAEIENARAREAWGFQGKTGWPDNPGMGMTPPEDWRAVRNRKIP